MHAHIHTHTTHTPTNTNNRKINNQVDLNGHEVAPSPYTVNRAGFVIHSAIHAARHDARSVGQPNRFGPCHAIHAACHVPVACCPLSSDLERVWERHVTVG